MSELAHKVGEQVRLLRKARGLTQRGLAEAASTHEKEITRAFVGALERGEKTPSLKTLEILAKSLEVTLAALLEGVDCEIVAENEPQRLGKLLSSLAASADPQELERFERVLHAFFGAGRPRTSRKRSTREKPSR